MRSASAKQDKSARQECKTRVQDKGARQGSETTEQGIGFEGTRQRRGKARCKTAVQINEVVIRFKGAWHGAKRMSSNQILEV